MQPVAKDCAMLDDIIDTCLREVIDPLQRFDYLSL
jgi:hypothetical protein